MNNTTTESAALEARYISIRNCKCGAGRTSALVHVHSALDAIADRRISCRACGEKLWARSVAGVVVEHIACGARCMASKGPTCDCSCGGKNHGSSYEAVA